LIQFIPYPVTIGFTAGIAVGSTTATSSASAPHSTRACSARRSSPSASPRPPRP